LVRLVRSGIANSKFQFLSGAIKKIDSQTLTMGIKDIELLIEVMETKIGIYSLLKRIDL